jgi:hypothetical protein
MYSAARFSPSDPVARPSKASLAKMLTSSVRRADKRSFDVVVGPQDENDTNRSAEKTIEIELSFMDIYSRGWRLFSNFALELKSAQKYAEPSK